MVLSNHKCMQIWIQISRILLQTYKSHSKYNSLNRIKFQIILLILQLETDYFSSLFISEMIHVSSGITVFHIDFQKLHSTWRDPRDSSNSTFLQTAFYTKKSYKILQILHYKGTHTETFQNPILHTRRQRALWLILHTEGKETFSPEKKFYT